MGDEDIPEREYVDLKCEESSVVHWGQMKLLLGEIEFLTPYVHVPELTVVYVGSSPGHHLPALVNLMPSTWKWELYDARPCEVYYSDNQMLLAKVAMQSRRGMLFGDEVKKECEAQAAEMEKIQAKAQQLIERLQYMSDRPEIPKITMGHTAEQLLKLQNTVIIPRTKLSNVSVHNTNLEPDEARKLRSRRPQTHADPQLLLISDLRTPMMRITEHTVHRDMMKQLDITRALQPYQASLKFKLPYSTEHFNPSCEYLPGEVRYQPLSPRISHETRLVTEPGSDFKTMVPYSTDEYARRMFHYQTVLRTSIYNTDEEVADPDRHKYLVGNNMATDHCYDCVAARHIARQYLAQIKSTAPALDLLDDLARQVASTQIACKSDGGGMLED
jgi:hypothetical protein